MYIYIANLVKVYNLNHRKLNIPKTKKPLFLCDP